MTDFPLSFKWDAHVKEIVADHEEDGHEECLTCPIALFHLNRAKDDVVGAVNQLRKHILYDIRMHETIMLDSEYNIAQKHGYAIAALKDVLKECDVLFGFKEVQE